ncbi:MAG TPA: cupin domain-containing protein [Rhizomicrobium sp.]|nr:cupin domain-containing protein [Rhizomicrobium sp.]
MKHRNIFVAAAALFLALAPAVAQDAPKVWWAWAPKPDPLTPWAAPNKPIWRVSEMLAAHKGHADWVRPIVRDRDYHADYVSMGAGSKTRPQFWADDRIFWFVTSGQIRFHIQGQEPFVASKGWMVQVPYRNIYWMETVGSEPSLRLEVIRNNRTPLFPATQHDTGPAPTAPGKTYVLASYRTPPDKCDEVNKPYLDFWGDFVKRPPTPGDHPFVADTTNFMNVIRGHGFPTPPDSNKGHFHIDYNEFWVIAEGTVDYKMEGMPVFTANVGDVVYAPQGRWHRASWSGNGMSTRIAINPRPYGMHNFDPESGAKQ